MSWFNTSGFSSLAKSAISQAQKSIDKVLDIKDEDGNERKHQKRSDKVGGLPKSSSKSELVSPKTKSPNQTSPALHEKISDKHSIDKKVPSNEEDVEDDSFFASFLGGTKHSTPKAEKSPVVKLKESITTKENEAKNTDSNIDEHHLLNEDAELNGSEVKCADNLKDIDTKSDDLEENQCQNTSSISNGEDSKISPVTGSFSKLLDVEDEILVNDCKDADNVKVEEDSADNDAFEDVEDLLAKPKRKAEDNSSDEKMSDNLQKDGSLDFNLEEDCGEKAKDVRTESSQNLEESLSSATNSENEHEPRKEESEIEASEASSSDENMCSSVISHEKLSSISDDNVLANSPLSQDDNIDVSQFVSRNEEDGIGHRSNEENALFEEEEEDVSKSINRSQSGGKNVNEKNALFEEEEEEFKKSITRSQSRGEDALDDIVEKAAFDNAVKLNREVDVCMANCLSQAEDNSDRLLSNIDSDAEELNKFPSAQSDEAEVVIEQDVVKDNDYDEPSYHEEKDDARACSSELCDHDVVEGLDKPDQSEEVAVLQKEVKRLQELVDARETKMVALSKENIDLQEASSILRNQLEQAELAPMGDDSVLMEMRDEFSQRIGELNTKLNKTTKERNELQKELEETTERLEKEQEQLINDFRSALEEKEEQIAGLLVEGEALSKRELKSNNAVKKLKLKTKELEKKVEKYEKEIADKDNDLKGLKETLDDKIEQEKTLQDQLKKLEVITDQQEDEISKLKDQIDDADDKMKGMQTTLDSGYQEINRLSLEKANRQSEIEEITLLKNTREELENKIKEIENEANLERQENHNQLASLRLIITRTEQGAARREDHLQLEIKDLHKRLEEAELRNQELSQSIATASRPLLRQIENLQSSHHSQAANWEKIEASLSERLASAHNQLALASEKERSAVDFAMDAKSRVAALEAQVKTLRVEKQELSDELEEKSETSRTMEENLSREKKKLDNISSNYRKNMEELQNEKIFIENQLNAERTKHETELSRMLTEYKTKGQLSRQNSSNAGNSLLTATKQGDKTALEEDIDHDAPGKSTRSRTSSSSSSSNVIDTNSRGASTAVMERLQTQLRQKDGELQLLKEEITTLQKTRASLAQELVDLANLVEDLQDKLRDSDEMKENHRALESRYNAALQMYGEKAEEADELRMDLEDIKQMYKQQIQQLIGER